MKQYLDLMRRALHAGKEKQDRTGTGTRSVFGHQMRFDLAHGFPIVTTKKVHFKSVVAELLWFLSGSTNVKDLRAMGCTIWDEWADKEGDLGPVYGKQWRHWLNIGIDQITTLVHALKNNQDDRGHIVSSWNVSQLSQMALRPCHCLFQCYVADGRLSLQLYQRSADIFLGVPFNIASYAMLTHMLAQQCDLEVGEFIWTGGDCHLYSNHLEQASLQLSRHPMHLPKLELKKAASIFDYKPSDFALVGYEHHPHISAPVAV